MTSPPISVADLEARLERELALHGERESFHAGEEAAHRARREHHAAERRRAEAELAAIRSAVERALRPPGAEPAAAPRAPAPPAAAPVKQISLAAAIEEVVESKAPGEAFSALDLTPEVNALFGELLGGPLDPAQVANFLRRLRADHLLDVVTEGRPHHPAVYRRPEPD